MTDGVPRRTPPTIYDVAKVAGVAPSTVSRAFARPGRVKTETAARIRVVAEQLGYRTNPIARALSTSRTQMIAVMVSDVANPFYAELIRGTQQAASAAGYVIVLGDARESGVFEREVLERLVQVVEGIVIGSSRMSDSALRTLAKQGPMVVLNRELPDVPSVITDNRGGMRAAVEHLRDLGHDAVTYVAGPEASWVDGVRWRSLQDVGRELGLHAHRIGPVPPTFEGGLSSVDRLRDPLPSALIAYNDLMSFGIMRGLDRTGLNVPRDISLIGFDDILTSRLVTPPLTTVAAPLRYMGAEALRNLLAVINGAVPRSGHAFVLPVKLMIRGSTGQRRRNRTSPALGTTKVSGSAS